MLYCHQIKKQCPERSIKMREDKIKEDKGKKADLSSLWVLH